MKSIKSSDVFACPNGCEDFEHDYWSLVDAGSNPELKEAVLGGELNLIMCPSCSSYFHRADNLIYADASCGLLVFVFDEKEKKDRAALKEKMAHDYEIIKNSLAGGAVFSGAPVCVFSLEELKEIARHEEIALQESEVIAASAAAAGYKIAALKHDYARANGFPFYAPAKGSKDAADLAASSEALLKTGLNSGRLKKFAAAARGENFKPEFL